MSQLNEELNLIKYLLNYDRGKILSEQKNILSEQTKSDYDQIANQLSTTWGTALKKYGFGDTIKFYETDANGNLIEEYTTTPTVVGITLTNPYQSGQDGIFNTAYFGCNTQIKFSKPEDKIKITAQAMVTNEFANISPYALRSVYANSTGEKNDSKFEALKKSFDTTTRNMAKQICQLIDSVSRGENIQPKLDAIAETEAKANQPKTTTPAKPTTPTTPAKPTTPSDNQPPFDKPIVEVVRKGNLWKVYAFGSFPVDVTKNNLSKEFIKEFAKKIFEDPVLLKTKGNVGITLANIRGGASNYNNGPVVPDIFFKGQSWKISYPMNANPEDPKYTGNDEVNRTLALNRAKNLFGEMKKILPNIATQLSDLKTDLQSKNPELTNPKINVSIEPTYTNFNVFTGDLNDTDRDKTKYPVPGQQVYMDLTIQIEPDKVKSASCMKGLSIEVTHLPHDCDAGQYNLYINDELIGMSDVSTKTLGVGSKPTLAYAAEGVKLNKYTNGQGGDPYGIRKDTFTISAEAVQKFLKNSKKGEVKISGQESAPGRHAEQPIFAVKNGTGVKLLSGFTPPANEKCTSSPCPKFTMVVFNPCSDDPSSAILGNDYGSV
jgi:hypothetical protein